MVVFLAGQRFDLRCFFAQLHIVSFKTRRPLLITHPLLVKVIEPTDTLHPPVRPSGELGIFDCGVDKLPALMRPAMGQFDMFFICLSIGM